MHEGDAGSGPTPWRLGVVRYLNARPLIAGLEGDDRFILRFEVPSALPALMERGEVDAALVPVIDLARPGRDWRIVSDACIGCDGETLTVRVFSRIPPQDIRRLHADMDSHTSVVLVQLLWRMAYGRVLEIVPFRGDEWVCDVPAVLLIGDKVVTHRPRDYDLEIDLGALWKEQTGLPFVFAVWAARAGCPAPHVLGGHLAAARDRGVAAAALIAEDFGPGAGWPVETARRYLTRRLRYELGPRQREGMRRFLHLARRYELVPETAEIVFA